jgi:hypothetical protein
VKKMQTIKINGKKRTLLSARTDSDNKGFIRLVLDGNQTLIFACPVGRDGQLPRVITDSKDGNGILLQYQDGETVRTGGAIIVHDEGDKQAMMAAESAGRYAPEIFTTAKKAAEHVGVDERTIRNWVRDGWIKGATHKDQKYHIPRKALEEYHANNP